MKVYKAKDFATKTAMEKAVRADFAEFIRQCLENNPEFEKTSLVDSNIYATVVGLYEDEDGCQKELVMTSKGTLKPYEDKKTAKKEVSQYIIEDEAELYQMKVKEAEDKAIKKKKEKEEKIKKDKEAREVKIKEAEDK